MILPPMAELLATYGYAVLLVGTFLEGESVLVAAGFLVVCVKFCKFFHDMMGNLKQLATENGPTQSSSEVARCVLH
ncbi:hypothetical protein [Desulfomicrobium escambiense]|uniref:hypothetical protein n=1 Tax=Desulfomicrobium escambiense TaxID=29503 RepID=UPI00041487DA|nr:hypothetical protein [Desulfomicrobium escambiense]